MGCSWTNNVAVEVWGNTSPTQHSRNKGLELQRRWTSTNTWWGAQQHRGEEQSLMVDCSDNGTVWQHRQFMSLLALNMTGFATSPVAALTTWFYYATELHIATAVPNKVVWFLGWKMWANKGSGSGLGPMEDDDRKNGSILNAMANYLFWTNRLLWAKNLPLCMITTEQCAKADQRELTLLEKINISQCLYRCSFTSNHLQHWSFYERLWSTCTTCWHQTAPTQGTLFKGSKTIERFRGNKDLLPFGSTTPCLNKVTWNSMWSRSTTGARRTWWSKMMGQQQPNQLLTWLQQQTSSKRWMVMKCLLLDEAQLYQIMRGDNMWLISRTPKTE